MRHEDEDHRLAHRFAEHAGILREVDAAETMRAIAREADTREWQDCLELFGRACCDTRGTIKGV